MNNKSSPDFMDELCTDRPSSRLMLLEAWNGLSFETQISVLLRVTSDKKYSENLDLLDKAMGSSNAYIRYLAAKNRWLELSYLQKAVPPRKTGLINSISQDPSPLVRYAREHSTGIINIEEDTVIFFAQPKEQRLAQLRQDPPLGGDFADILRIAVKMEIPAEEVVEMVEEYSNCEDGAYYFCFFNNSLDDLDGSGELWKVVEEMPEAYAEIAKILKFKLRISDEEFALQLNRQKFSETMRYSQGLSPVQTLCLDDYCLWKYDTKYAMGHVISAYKIKQLPPELKKKYTSEMQLYELASRLVPLPGQLFGHIKPFPKKLAKLSKLLMPNDPWGTYINMKEFMFSSPQSTRNALIKYIKTMVDVEEYDTLTDKEIVNQQELLRRCTRLELMICIILVILCVQVFWGRIL